MALFDMGMQPLRYDGLFHFNTTDIASRPRDGGIEIAASRDNWHIPPMDILFLQRKIGGLFLLGSRLKAQVDIRAIFGKMPLTVASRLYFHAFPKR
jgi:hypothetical protein